MEGMALQDPPYRERDTFHSSILFHRLKAINRTGWSKPTTLGEKGGECILIHLYEPYDYFIHGALLPIDQGIKGKMTEKSRQVFENSFVL
jgi:hypothetical protein